VMTATFPSRRPDMVLLSDCSFLDDISAVEGNIPANIDR
jgi:hypothetical protein